MKTFQDLVATDFPGIDPNKFEAWKQAELAFHARLQAFLKPGAAITVVVFAGLGLALGREGHLVLRALVPLTLWLWYAHAILRISPKGQVVKTLYKETGIHWKSLWIALGLPAPILSLPIKREFACLGS